MYVNRAKSLIKVLKIAALIIPILFFIKNIDADPRSHVTAGGGSITDEGFRWKNSLNFNINLAGAGAGPVPLWYFNNGAGFVAHATQSNGIHIALSNIVNAVRTLPIAGPPWSHASAAAITIVVQNPNTAGLEAYSEIIKEDLVNNAGNVVNVPAISIPATPNNNIPQCNAITNNGMSMYYTNTKVPPAIANVQTHVGNIANGLIEANIPVIAGAGNYYGCCEGQIVARLFDTNPPNTVAIAPGALMPAPPPAAPVALFPQIINNLIVAANLPVHHGGMALAAPITLNNIVLVVLHIHSHYDPCAKCSKALSGLSRQMNMPAAGGLNTQSQAMTDLLNGVPFAVFGAAAGFVGIANLIANLRAGATKFIVEVSSDSAYLHQGNQCSFAELSGHDNNIANIATIDVNPGAPVAINFAAIANQGLSIPNGLVAGNNWSFPTTFPPYVIYGRITGGAIVNAPTGRCNVGNNHNTILTIPPPLHPAL